MLKGLSYYSSLEVFSLPSHAMYFSKSSSRSFTLSLIRSLTAPPPATAQQALKGLSLTLSNLSLSLSLSPLSLPPFPVTANKSSSLSRSLPPSTPTSQHTLQQVSSFSVSLSNCLSICFSLEDSAPLSPSISSSFLLPQLSQRLNVSPLSLSQSPPPVYTL